jgi:hypothetical protein
MFVQITGEHSTTESRDHDVFEYLVSCPINSCHISTLSLRYLSDWRYSDGEGTTEGGTGFERS